MTSRRYEALFKIASGGTAAVYVGSAVGALGFRQLVAIKRPHAHLSDDPAFCAALVEEARIASRLHHANVVDVRDVEVDEHGVQLVMDYVEGASLSELIRGWAKEPSARPAAVALRVMLDACEGLRALHELAGDDGAPLGLVHRDVSPANVLVGLDGVARIADFGLAKSLLAVERTTSDGTLRGKLGYMAPEYIRGKGIDRRVDIFAAGVVLWELLAHKRLFRGDNDGDTLDRVQTMPIPPLASVAPRLDAGAASDLDGVIAEALARDPARRFATIDALARALERVAREHDLGASHADVRASFAPALRAELDERRKRIQAATSAASSGSSASFGSPASPASSRASQLPALAVSEPSLPAPLTTSTSAPPPPPGPAPTSPEAPATGARGGGRSRALLVALGLGALVVVAAVAAGTSAARGSLGARDGAPRTVTPAVEPLAGQLRARAVAPEPAGSSDGATSPSGRASPGRAPPRPTSDEPGKKPPRPNPYASAAPR